jgi:hypothetical protein
MTEIVKTNPGQLLDQPGRGRWGWPRRWAVTAVRECACTSPQQRHGPQDPNLLAQELGPPCPNRPAGPFSP